MQHTATTRRNFLKAGTAAAAGATMLTATGTVSAQSEFDGYLDDVDNFDGDVVDATDQDSVTIGVGADGNGGPYGFGPPAVRVTPGTTIVWEWVAELHNVVDEAGAFESETTDEAGHTFEYTVEEPGVIQYYCGPHKPMGMKGVVDVVEASSQAGGAPADGAPAGGTGEDAQSGGEGVTEREHRVGPAVPSVVALAFVLPAAYAALTGHDGEDGAR